MKRAKRMAALAGSMVLACSVLVAGATPAAASVSGVRLSVRCIWNPESITIKNSRSRSITIVSVGSTYQKLASEPFVVNKVLKSGKSITYTFGGAPGVNKLSSKFIFSDSNSTERARITTNLGTVTTSCGT
jgi:hypothetical protein